MQNSKWSYCPNTSLTRTWKFRKQFNTRQNVGFLLSPLNAERTRSNTSDRKQTLQPIFGYEKQCSPNQEFFLPWTRASHTVFFTNLGSTSCTVLYVETTSMPKNLSYCRIHITTMYRIYAWAACATFCCVYTCLYI